MLIAHDAAAYDALHRRIEALHPKSRRQWGEMSVDQMLWHINKVMSIALGEVEPLPFPGALPVPVSKFFVLRLPWPKSAPTGPDLVATGRYDFCAERKRALKLLEAIHETPLRVPWPSHPTYGQLSGMEWSKLTYRHLDHHLRQFGA